MYVGLVSLMIHALARVCNGLNERFAVWSPDAAPLALARPRTSARRRPLRRSATRPARPWESARGLRLGSARLGAEAGGLAADDQRAGRRPVHLVVGLGRRAPRPTRPAARRALRHGIPRPAGAGSAAGSARPSRCARPLGSRGPTQPGVRMTWSTPAASALRRMVPRLPGSRSWSSTKTNVEAAGGGDTRGIGTTAITPCDVTVSVRVPNTLGAELERRLRPRPAASQQRGRARVAARLHRGKKESGVRPRSHGFFDQPHTFDQAAALLAPALRLQAAPGPP